MRNFLLPEGEYFVPGIGPAVVEHIFVATVFSGYRIIPVAYDGSFGEPRYMEILP